MANFVPKIEYTPDGGSPTTITFDLPPEEDNLNQDTRGANRRTISNNGTVQVQNNYEEDRFQVNFVFLSQALVDSLRTFMETHALKGEEFKYFEHSDEVEFFTVTLQNFEFRPRRLAPDGAGGFIHDLRITMRRTL